MNAERMDWEGAVLWLRSQPDQSDLVRACFYDDPLSEAACRFYESDEWSGVRALLPRRVGRALDVGSGRGISAYALAKEGWKVTALEPDPSPVVGAGAIRSLLEESDIQCDVVQEWGERLPFDDASFDLVYCRQSLHHARDLPQLCGELGRVLRNGGRFIATREHVISRPEDLPTFLENHPLHRLYGGENAYLLKDYRTSIEAAGIRIDKVLNPLESPINLYPESRASIKRRIAAHFRWPFPSTIPDFVIVILGHVLRSPGRLYSFVGTRSARG